jgi:hypothetical protein
MPRYRFRFRTNGRVLQVRQAECTDDEQAKVLAEGNLNAADRAIISVEVWQGTRLVRRIQRHG